MQDRLGIWQAATPTLLRSSPTKGHRRRPNEYRGGAYVTAAIEAREKWVTKQKVAVHFSVTTRWIESQQALGLPYMHMGGINRYVLSEVEAWMREQYGEPRAEAA
jgi:hypothetical protein